MAMYRSRVFKGEDGDCMYDPDNTAWRTVQYCDTLPDITINTIDHCCGAMRRFAGVSLCLFSLDLYYHLLMWLSTVSPGSANFLSRIRALACLLVHLPEILAQMLRSERLFLDKFTDSRARRLHNPNMKI
jgi:hypothetical protein